MDEKLGVYEELDSYIRQQMADSEDPEYTDYLRKQYNRLIQQKYQLDLLKTELNRSHKIYADRMERNLGQKSQKSMEELADVERQANTETPRVNTLREQVEEIPNVSVMKPKANTEFAIGAAVLSVVGGGFILAALVTLGMTFMGGMFKGICLYAVALAFLLVSELFVARKIPMLGATLTSIGIGGLYLSTAVNYLTWHNFNLWVTLGITLAITLGVILLSRKRDSVLYRVIGMIAGYLGFFVIREGIADTGFIVVSGIILLMNILCILMPIRKFRTAVNISHMYVNSFFAVCFVLKAKLGCEVATPQVLIFVITSLLILQILYIVQCYSNQKIGRESCHVGLLCAYYISLACYFIMACILTSGTEWYAYNTAAALCVMGILAVCALGLKKCPGVRHIYVFLNLTLFFLVGCAGGEWIYTISLLSLLVVAKIICCKKNMVTYRIVDVSATVLLCLELMIREGAHAYLVIAGLLVSILFVKYWQTFYEILLTAFLVIYMAFYLPTIIQLPVIVGTMLVGILAFNSVRRWRGNRIIIFNIYALVVQGICFLALSGNIYRNEYITYLCMLVFGFATIILTFRDKYQMNFKGKYLVLATFLTYMVFIFKTNIPVINSILLMIIALLCVGIGFGMQTKGVRIYGLVLALAVCGKLVLYDFFGVATMQKTILFFVVGVIALTIAAIYIILEKRNNS